MASRSAAGIPSAYINNFIQIWCGTPFYSMPCRSNSCWIYLEPHGLAFESSGRKYIWIILLRSNTDDSRSGFHGADCNLWQCPALVCRMIWICIHSAPDDGLWCTVTGNRNRLKPALLFVITSITVHSLNFLVVWNGLVQDIVLDMTPWASPSLPSASTHCEIISLVVCQRQPT